MRIIAALFALVSVQAFACPNLAGNYVCKYEDGSTENISISQTVQNGVTVYIYNGSNVPADNQTYQVPDDESLKQGTFRAWCDEPTTLKAQLMGKYYSGGAYYGDLTLNMAFSKSGMDLMQITTGNLKNSGGEYPLDSKTTCGRIN